MDDYTQDNPIIQAAANNIQLANTVVKKQAQNAIAASNKAIVNNADATQALNNDTMTAARNQVIVNQTQQSGELAARNANINLMNSVGGSQTQVNLLKELYADTERTSNLEDDIQQKMSKEHTGIGIIDTVINSFSTIGEQSQLYWAKEKQAQTATQISALTGAEDAFINQNNKLAQTSNEASIKASGDVILSTARAQADQNNLSAIKSNAVLTQNALQASKQAVDAAMTTYNTLNNERTVKSQQKVKALQEQQMQLQIDTMKQNLAKGKATAEQQENFNRYIGDTYRKGLAVMGLDTNVPDSYAVAEYSANPAKTMKIISMGSQPNGPIADSPAEAQTVRYGISSSGGQTTRGTKMLDAIQYNVDQYYGSPAIGGNVPKDVNARNLVYNNLATQYENEKSSNIATGDNSNPYAAPPMSVLSQVKAVQEDPLYKKVLSTMKNQTTDPEVVADAAVSGVLAGGVTQEQAAEGIANLFKSAIHLNNTQDGGYARYGLKNQTSYKVQVKDPGKLAWRTLPWSISSVPVVPKILTVDFSNVTQVMNYLNKLMYRRKQEGQK